MGLTAHANARNYYELKRQSEDKKEKTLQAGLREGGEREKEKGKEKKKIF